MALFLSSSFSLTTLLITHFLSPKPRRRGSGPYFTITIMLVDGNLILEVTNWKMQYIATNIWIRSKYKT